MELENDLSMTGFFMSYSFICVYALLNMRVTWLHFSEWLPHSASAYTHSCHCGMHRLTFVHKNEDDAKHVISKH